MSLQTEAIIKEAAKSVFLQKGYLGATTRDIAQEAGLNRALVNYYFRSKENLFATVFTEMAQKYFDEITLVLQQDISFFDKLDFILEQELAAHFREPQLANFLMRRSQDQDSELETLLQPTFNRLVQNFLDFLDLQIQKAVDKGEIISIQPNHLLLLMSSIKYLFASKRVFTTPSQCMDISFEEFVRSHKKVLMDALRAYLKK